MDPKMRLERTVPRRLRPLFPNLTQP